MALNVGVLVAELRLDDKQYQRGVDQGEKRFSRLGSFLAGSAKAVGAAGAGAIAAAGAVGISTAAQMEQAKIAFTTMLGSGQKADAFLRDLSAFAAKTPFEFPELQTAASSLVSAGIEADKVIPIMTTLGDVTSGMGTGSEGVKRATVALQQMNAAGRITGEDLNQLRDAGIPVYDLLASATGKSKAEVVALAQAGKLGKTELGQMMEALESGKGLERFSGLMKEQSQSLTGLWSTLKDTFSVGMATAIEPLIPLIKQGLGGASDFLAKVLPKVAVGLTGFANGLTGLGPVPGYTGWLNTLGDTLNQLWSGFTLGKDGLEEIGGPLEGFAAKGYRAREMLTAVTSVASQFFAGLRGRGELQALGSGLTGVQAAGLKVRGWLQQIPPMWDALIEKVRSARQEFGGVSLSTGEASGGMSLLGGVIGTLVTVAGGLEPVVRVAGVVFGFLASHTDTLAKYMPLLIGAFIAYKAAQAAANIAAIAAVPVQAAQIASNFALAAALRAHAAALGYERVGMLTRIGTFIRSTAVTIGHTIALAALRVGILLTSGAIHAMTAAQWLLTRAMSMSPIGKVITLISLLVGGLVVAYKNSETFRRIVDGAFRAVSDAGRFMWNDVLKPVFRTMLGVWLSAADGIIGAASRVARALGMDGLADKLDAAKGELRDFKDSAMRSLDIPDQSVTVTAFGKLVLPAGFTSRDAASFARRDAAMANRQNRATGGPIKGAGTGTSDSIPAIGPGGAQYALSDDEHVWTAEEVRKVGGHGNMLALREQVRRLADGGPVLSVRAAGRTGNLRQGAQTLSDRQAAQMRNLGQFAINGGAAAVTRGYAASVAATARAAAPSASSAGRGNIDAELLRRFDLFNRSVGGALRVVSGYRSSAKQAALYAAYLNGTGNLAARPGSSNHEKSPARAIDYGPASWARTAGAYRFGLAAPVRSEPWHLERAYDRGGEARGPGWMRKATLRPERVLSPRQTTAYERHIALLERDGSTSSGPVTLSRESLLDLAQAINGRPAVLTVDGEVLAELGERKRRRQLAQAGL